MKKKYKKYSVLIIIFLIATTFLYLTSYSFLLPISEKLGISSFAYCIYEPIEFIRLKSDIFFFLTESGYKTCLGNISPENRYFFHSKRRILRILKGKRIETIFIDGNVISHKIFYKNGNIWVQEIIKGKTREKTTFFTNGIIFNQMLFNVKDFKPIDGIYIWKDKLGKIIACCEYKNGTPYNGSEIFNNNYYGFMKGGYMGYDYNFKDWLKLRYYRDGTMSEEKDIYLSKDGEVSFRNSHLNKNINNDITPISVKDIPDSV